MNKKALSVLEYDKVIGRLAGYASFDASKELAKALYPITHSAQIQKLQIQTREALLLLDSSDFTGIGSVHDVRNLVDRARRGGVLEPKEIQEIKETLISSRELVRSFDRKEDLFPHLLEILRTISHPTGLIESIGRVISDQAEVLDTASPALSRIRAETKVNHDRLFTKLQKIISDTRTAPMLQEAIITQREGRYVVPLRAEYKGQLKAIVHDQSSSGATIFVEPLVVVDLNNRVRELELDERNEVHRILSVLSGDIGEKADEIAGIVDALAQFDLAIMRAKYAAALNASEPMLLESKDPRHKGSINLIKARHPLLDPDKVVPIDVIFDPATTCLVITGPNTGGKTVTLKTVGLLSLMAQSGLYIPALSGSELSIFQNIYADIGDEQSIEQSLSTFSGHVKNLVSILEAADEHSLVLLDELGAGTDPQEGSTLARSILEFLLEKKVPSLVATHYPELKIFAYTHAGAMNASLEFNLKTLKPTYHLILGIPGRSNALIIAERLGMPADIISRARASVAQEEKQADTMLEEINRQREASKKVRSSADRMRTEIEKQQKQIADRLAGIENERKQILVATRKQAEAELDELMEEIEVARRDLSKARQPLDQINNTRKSTETIREMIQKPVKQARVNPSPNTPVTKPRYKPGDRVFVASLNLQAVVTEVGDEDVEVQFGSLRARTSIEDVQANNPSEQSLETNKKKSVTVTRAGSPARPSVYRESPGLELNIRGKRVDEAEPLLERYLENAYMARLPFARILHGKGTGTLRQVVQEWLRSSPYVDSWELATEKEGGAGVTVVKFKND